MLKFYNVSFRNFLSYGNTETVVDLSKAGSTLIAGRNLDASPDGSASNGVGKAQPLYSRIKTPSGWTTMGEVRVGDTVTTASGADTTVTGVFPQGLRPTYRVTFEDGRTADADESHLWEVSSHKWGPVSDSASKRKSMTITTRQLKEHVDAATKPYHNIFVPLAQHRVADDAVLPINPYLIGALIGDGSLMLSRTNFTTADEYIRHRVDAELKEMSLHLKDQGDGINYRIQHLVGEGSKRPKIKPMGDVLAKLGLAGTKSHTKFIPQEYKDSTSREQKVQLLQGLLDTDGTVSNTGSISYSSTSRQLAEDVQYLVRSIGGRAKISIRRPFYYDKDRNRVAGRPSYNVRISVSTPLDVLSLPRKLEKARTKSQYSDAGLRVVSVEYVGDIECQCIMVSDPSHLYVTDDFVVTHNTVIINAITYALYDKPLSKINKDNLVNTINDKHMEVSVVFSLGTTFYKIKRFRKMKVGPSGNYAKLYERKGDANFVELPPSEGGDEVTLDSNSNTTDYIAQKIGIPYELFVRIVVFSGSHIPFLSMPSKHPTQPSQQSFIEELFDLKMLTEKAEVLKERTKANEQEFLLLNTKNEMAEKSRTRHDQQIADTMIKAAEWDARRTSEIESSRTKLKSVEGLDLEAERAIQEVIEQLNSAINTLDTETLAIERKIRNGIKERTRLEGEIAHLEDSKCPYCSQEYHDDDKLTALRASLEATSQDVMAHEATLAELQKQYDEAHAMLAEHKAKQKIANVNELMTIQFQQNDILASIERRTQEQNPYTEVLEMLKTQTPDAVDYTRINELAEEIEHQKFLIKLLTKNDSFIRKAMLNKNLPFLNKQLNQYLRRMELPHVVEFTHELTPRISRFGSEFDFDQLSTGQKARVNIALSLAFRDVLQSLHHKINLFCVDEVLDVGLDAAGVMMAAKLLKEEARKSGTCMFVISHREEISSSFDQKMYVIFKDSFSRAYQGPERLAEAELLLHEAA